MPEFKKEVRLGIVMYGGVSLAVYENGVTQELFRAVKGLGPYALLKQLLDADIVVDIVSGTSAGGINGIMLAYALANDRDFRTSAKLWRKSGDLGKLLRGLDDPGSNSILDSRGFYQPQLETAFREMGPAVPGAAASRVSELDLFVTGTNAYGNIWTVFDDNGHPIDLKSHRALFTLSYRGPRKNDFDGKLPETPVALAKLSRITSCFPVAFEPVELPEPSPAPYENISDRRLKRWGKLGHPDEPWNPTRRAPSFFLDGGLLDNKPFSSTIDAIFRRTADREVDRVLFYVEPDPERFQAAHPEKMPDVAHAAISALIGIPGYQSIASDLEAINRHNDRVIQFWEMAASLDAAADGVPMDWAALRAQDDKRASIYSSTRLQKLRGRVVSGILKDSGRRELLTADARAAANALVRSFNHWQGSGAETLEEFDVYYRMRRATRLIYRIYHSLYPEAAAPAPNTADYRDLWRALNHHFKLLEILQFAMEDLVDRARVVDLKRARAEEIDAAALWRKVQSALRWLLLAEGIELPSDRPRERESFAAALNARKADLIARFPELDDRPAFDSRNLLRTLDALEESLVARFAGRAPDVSRERRNFFYTDSHLFPIEFAAELEAKDVIRTVRISPIDARKGFSNKSLEAKLAGAQLGHFGGFLKRSWRSNDILWGRLDGLCQLFECLATRKSIHPENLPVDMQEQINAVLRKCEIQASAPELRSLTDGDWEKFMDALVTEMQTGILREEVPRVVEDALQQQMEWNQYARPAGPGSAKVVWTTGGAAIDPLLTTAAAHQLSEQALASTKDWAAWFRDHYEVGSEKYNRDIPVPVLLEWAAHTGLALRRCLLAALGDKRKAVEKSRAYRYFFEYPLWALYGFARLEQRIPRFAAILAGGFAGAVAAAVALYILLRQSAALTIIQQAEADPNPFWLGALLMFAIALIFLLGGPLMKWAARRLAR